MAPRSSRSPSPSQSLCPPHPSDWFPLRPWRTQPAAVGRPHLSVITSSSLTSPDSAWCTPESRLHITDASAEPSWNSASPQRSHSCPLHGGPKPSLASCCPGLASSLAPDLVGGSGELYPEVSQERGHSDSLRSDPGSHVPPTLNASSVLMLLVIVLLFPARLPCAGGFIITGDSVVTAPVGLILTT